MDTYHFQNEEHIPSPALVYYKDVIVKNTETAIREAKGADHLWPHVKSHKMEEVLRLQARMGIKRFKCATIVEAEMAAAAGGEHILLSYPLVGPNQERFLELVKRWPDSAFYAIGDDLDQVRALADKADRKRLVVNLCVDVNTGMNRTGVEFKQLPQFCEELAEVKGLKLAGLHCYDGNRHEKDLSERREKVRETVETLCQILEGLSGENLLLIMGGSPSFPCYAKEMKDGHVFYSPGTVFIYDAGYREQFPDLPYEPGAAILTRVVSHPAEGYFTIDCGYKAISAEQLLPGILTGAPHAKPAFQSEEHWTFCMEEGYEQERPAIGQILYVLPWHICPTTALYQEAVVVNQGKTEGCWRVSARNRLPEPDLAKIQIL